MPFNESNYMFHDPDAQPRSSARAGFGFRCMQAEDRRAIKKLLAPDRIAGAGLLRDQASGRRRSTRRIGTCTTTTGCRSTAESRRAITSNPHWRRERVSMRLPYGDERMPTATFSSRRTYHAPLSDDRVLPRDADAVMRCNQAARCGSQILEFIITKRTGRGVSGVSADLRAARAVQRRPGFSASDQHPARTGRPADDRLSRDASRHRSDRGSRSTVSVSARNSHPVYLAIEPRFRTGVLLSGGIETWTIPPETDPVNFVTRVKQPVMMVNGREDFDLPYESAQVPMFKMLGTPEADKRHVVFEGGQYRRGRTRCSRKFSIGSIATWGQSPDNPGCLEVLPW